MGRSPRPPQVAFRLPTRCRGRSCSAAAGAAAPVRRDLLDWEELGNMTETGLVRVGSHTRRHTRLRAGLPRQLVEEEIAGSAASIAERLGRPPALFCYPNGEVSPEAVPFVAANYRGALTTTRGWKAACAAGSARSACPWTSKAGT